MCQISPPDWSDGSLNENELRRIVPKETAVRVPIPAGAVEPISDLLLGFSRPESYGDMGHGLALRSPPVKCSLPHQMPIKRQRRPSVNLEVSCSIAVGDPAPLTSIRANRHPKQFSLRPSHIHFERPPGPKP